MDIFSVLGQRLKERRLAAGLTQLEAAEAAGVAQTYVSNLENGSNRPGAVELLYHLAEQYETSLDYLFGRIGNYQLLKEEKPPTQATQLLLETIADLPEHRRDDLVALAEGLLKEEERRYAFWLIVRCATCKEPMVGRIAEDGEIFYACETETCERHTIPESQLARAVIEVTEHIVKEIKSPITVDASENNTFVTSLKNLGRRLGLIKSRQEPSPVNLLEIVKDILAHEDRTIAQRWMHAHIRIHVKDGGVSEFELL